MDVQQGEAETGDDVNTDKLEEFWGEQHRQGNTLYLAGYGAQTVDLLLLENKPKGVVLNIGVGIGSFEAWLRDKVVRIDSLDITPQAFNAVATVVDNFYTSPRDIPDDTYDLITCLLVAQHVTAETLEVLVSNSIRALREGGLFALQTADWLNPPVKEEWLTNSTIECLQAGGVKHPPSFLTQVVRTQGGMVVNMEITGKFPQYNSVWRVYHIVKRAEV